MAGSKEPIRLRKRLTSSGYYSLYLDIYHNGKRSYEYLKLYLIPEHTRADKEKNKETMRLADAIRAKRVVEFRNGEYGFRSHNNGNTNFYDYYMAMCEARRKSESTGNQNNWKGALTHLEQYDKNLRNRTFLEIDRNYILGFKEYLENRASAYHKHDTYNTHALSVNSQSSYFEKLRSCLNQAYNEHIMPHNPLQGIRGIKMEDCKRMYLTIDEVRELAQTPCNFDGIRRSFLFSCLTGLRRSDIAKLTWGEIHQQGEFTRIIFRQKKTGGQEYLDIAPEAVALLGERGEADEHPFAKMYSDVYANMIIKNWCLQAGIDKNITFHCGRHTFATMMLDIGTDIYTVSKLLGHRELSTTQIYAKVLDKNKQEAVARIPQILTQNDSKE